METTSTEQKPAEAAPTTFIIRWKRKAAAGKALLVYLGTGSVGAAVVAYLIFKGAGADNFAHPDGLSQPTLVR